MLSRRWALWLAGIGLLVGLALGEWVAVSILGLGTPPLSVAHPTIEYMFKPNQDIHRFHNRIVVNQYGMRTHGFDVEKQSNELRVMVYGDSVVNGGNQTDHESLATTILEHKLIALLNRPVTVGNVSAGSWGPGNWLAYADEYGFFGADIVALVVSSHDYKDNPTFAKLNENTHPTSVPASALYEGATRYLPRYLPDFLQSEGQDLAVGSELVTTGEQTRRGLRDLKRFLTLGQQSSAKVLVLQHWTESELRASDEAEGYLEIRRICKQLGIEPLSLDSAYREAIGGPQELYRDDIHINEFGQAVLADSLYSSVVDLVRPARSDTTGAYNEPL